MSVNAIANRCHECAHHEPTTVFDLCKHSSSRYSIAGKEDFHTIGHMRSVGACRGEAVLFAPIVVARRKAA